MNALNPDSQSQRKRRRRVVTRETLLAALPTRAQNQVGITASELHAKTGFSVAVITNTLRALSIEKLVERDAKREPYGDPIKGRTKAIRYYFLRDAAVSALQCVTLYRAEKARRDERVRRQIDEARITFKQVLESTDNGREHRKNAHRSRIASKLRAQHAAEA